MQIVGKVIRVLDHGTIVQVVLEQDDGRPYFINFDHRPFAHFAESESFSGVGDVLTVEIDDDGNEYVEVIG